jgi:2-dehydro-3-deoxy-D-pentonate aldolase
LNAASHKFRGVFPPVCTMFDQDGGFDWFANESLCDHLIERGVNGLLFLGSTGEFSSLTIKERKTFAAKMTSYVDGRVPVLIGVGSSSLKETIELSKHAEQSGASGVLVVSPYYWKFTEDQLFDYFITVAESITIPVLLYNIPLLTGQSLSPQLVARLAESCENIAGIKDTIDSLKHIGQIIHSVKEKRSDFAVFAAFDDLILPALQIGAAGSINGTSVFAPERSVHLYNSFSDGNYEEAIKHHHSILPLLSIYDVAQPLFIGIKEAVHQSVLGYETSIRKPVMTIDEKTKQKVREYLVLNNLNCNPREKNTSY